MDINKYAAGKCNNLKIIPVPIITMLIILKILVAFVLLSTVLLKKRNEMPVNTNAKQKISETGKIFSLLNLIKKKNVATAKPVEIK